MFALKDKQNNKPELLANNTDRLASLTKGIFGAAPVVGSFIAEIISNVIPNQRIDRLSEFVSILDEKIVSLDRGMLKLQFEDETFVDLLEDGFQSAARALSKERKEYIASLIATSISDDQIKHLQSKQLLLLLRELSDPEIILLQFYAKLTSGDSNSYIEKHKGIIKGPRSHFRPSSTELDQHALHATYKLHLERLGLVKPHFRRTKPNELPKFDDKTGMVKASHYGITWLGRLLLRFIGLDDG